MSGFGSVAGGYVGLWGWFQMVRVGYEWFEVDPLIFGLSVMVSLMIA